MPNSIKEVIIVELYVIKLRLLLDYLSNAPTWLFTGGTYLFKVNSGNTRTMCKIRLKLMIKTPERRH